MISPEEVRQTRTSGQRAAAALLSLPKEGRKRYNNEENEENESNQDAVYKQDRLRVYHR